MNRQYLILFIFSIHFFNVSAVDFNANATQNIDNRIANKHTTVNKPIFSVQNHTNGNYLRNLNCWAADIDLTCVSPWNSRGVNLQAGTLITPRHCILAAHFNLKAGDSIRFVTANNETIRRKIIAHKVNTDFASNMPDLEIITLDKDVPSSISPCQFLPANYNSYLSNDGVGLPVLYTDQEEKALVADIWSINSTKLFELQIPFMFNRTSLNEAIINGDSGNPIFLILNGKPVIIGCFTWGGAGSGNSLTYYANLTNGGVQPEQNINDLIKATDAIAGINTGYKISLFDFSTTALQTQNSSNEINIRIVDNNLIVDIESININSSIQITDILGKVVLFKKLSNQHTEIFLNKNGVCFITIKNGNKTMTTKLMTK